MSDTTPDEDLREKIRRDWANEYEDSNDSFEYINRQIHDCVFFGADINQHDGMLIHDAIDQYSIIKVRALLENGIDPNATRMDKRVGKPVSAFERCCLNCIFAEESYKRLKRGYNEYLKDPKQLENAAKKMAMYLALNGADITKKDEYGISYLDYFCDSNAQEEIKRAAGKFQEAKIQRHEEILKKIQKSLQTSRNWNNTTGVKSFKRDGQNNEEAISLSIKINPNQNISNYLKKEVAGLSVENHGNNEVIEKLAQKEGNQDALSEAKKDNVEISETKVYMPSERKGDGKNSNIAQPPETPKIFGEGDGIAPPPATPNIFGEDNNIASPPETPDILSKKGSSHPPVTPDNLKGGR